MSYKYKVGEQLRHIATGTIYIVAKRRTRAGIDPKGKYALLLEAEGGQVQSNIRESSVAYYFEREAADV